MARGRMIASTVATDKRLNALTAEAALIYLMAIPHLDRDGLILGDTMPLWGKVCPRRTEFMDRMTDVIGEWLKVGLVIAYECEEGTVLFFTGFGKNQTGMRYDREGASAFPPPPGYARTNDGLEKMVCGLSPEQVRIESGVSPAQSKVNKTKTKEANANGGGSDPWGDVVETYKHEIGVVTEHIGESMHEYYDEMGATLLVDAIKEAATQNKRSWAYVAGILKKWRVNGRASPKEGSTNAWEQLGDIPDYMRQ